MNIGQLQDNVWFSLWKALNLGLESKSILITCLITFKSTFEHKKFTWCKLNFVEIRLRLFLQIQFDPDLSLKTLIQTCT